jgi:hypothetical protein
VKRKAAFFDWSGFFLTHGLPIHDLRCFREIADSNINNAFSMVCRNLSSVTLVRVTIEYGRFGSIWPIVQSAAPNSISTYLLEETAAEADRGPFVEVQLAQPGAEPRVKARA